MKRWLVLIGCVVAAVACDPLLPLRVKDEVQPVSELLVQGPSGNVPSGTTASIIVEALDGGDNTINLSSKEIEITVSNEDVVTVVEGTPKGTLLATGKAVGSATVTVKIDDVSESTTLSVIPGSPGQIALTSGGSQLGVVNDPLLQNLAFQVRDAFGNAVQSGVAVTFTTTSGSVPTSAQTNASGQVSVSYTPGTVGNQSVTARVGSGTSVQVIVPVVVTTIQPVLSATVANPRSGITMTPAPVVQLQYASTAQPYPRSGKTVIAEITGSTTRSVTNGGSIVTNSAGIATFDALRISGTAGTTNVRFTVSSSGTSVDAPVTLLGGAPNSITIATQPSPSVVTGRIFAQPPVVQLYDSWNNPSPEANVSIEAGMATTSGLGTSFTNPIAISDATGKATFSTLTLSGTVGSRTIRFTSPSHSSLTFATTNSILLTGVESRLVVERTTSSFACAAVPTSTPRVQLYDAGSNAVPTAGITVTATLVGTGATINAGGTAVTNSSGLADFSTLKLKGPVGSYSIEFSAASAATPPTQLTKVTMPFNIVAGSADSLAILTQPPATATNGVTFTTTPVVRVFDDCSNLVNNSNVDVTVGTTTGSATFTNGTRTTSTGEATFTSLQMAALAGNYTLRFTSPGTVTATAAAPTALASGAAAKVHLATEPTATTPSNSVFATQPRVTITDVGGNAAAGARAITTSILAPANGAVITSGSATTAADGTVTFAGMKITGVAGTYQVLFNSSGLTSDTATVQLAGANTASKITIDTPPASASFSGIILPRVPVVQLRDVDNDTVHLSNISVTITSTGNPFTINNGSLVTDAVGKVTFPSLSLSGVVQSTGTLTFTVPGLPPVNATVPNIIATPLTNNTPLGFSDSPGTSKYYGITVPASQAKLTVTISNASGDPELLVRQSDAATTSLQSACTTTTAGTTRTCEILTPAAGTYFITVRSATNLHSGTLRAVYVP